MEHEVDAVDLADDRVSKAIAKFARQVEYRCRVCGCTQMDGCPGGCGWAPGQGNLCTICAAAIEALRQWRENARRANVAALMREAKTVPPVPRKLIQHLRQAAAKGGRS